MVTLTWFESEKELQELTGLNHDELWDSGFDLDDWDFGIQTDRDTIPDGEYRINLGEDALELGWLFEEGYKAQHVEYNGKHYYMSYHS